VQDPEVAWPHLLGHVRKFQAYIGEKTLGSEIRATWKFPGRMYRWEWFLEERRFIVDLNVFPGKH
jgi:hypothetical protein